MQNRMVLPWILASLLLVSVICPQEAEAWLYHATRRAVAKRIMKHGVNPSKFKARSRFGKGFYTSSRPGTAVAEKGKGNVLIRLKENSSFHKRAMDLRIPKPENLRKYAGPKYDMRGAVKRQIIGPKLGKKVGKWAAKNGKIIKYRSTKNGGSNFFIPGQTLKSNKKVIIPQKIIDR